MTEPAWRRPTNGESRWAASIAIVVAIGCQVLLPVQFSLRPQYLIPAIEAVLLVGSIAVNPNRIDRHSSALRYANLVVIAVLSGANLWSASILIRHLLHGQETDATRLLASGAAIWITNVIAFALWYWEFDRGGPGRRSEGVNRYPDFLFPQMQAEDMAPPEWEPEFVDYFYMSFTNSTAFSPTDVLPLSQWAKLTMMSQSALSFLTVILVVARAVNTLR
ncbi:MAG: hypothetical protein U0Q22_12155 [Acidimicrobiales bacterium]